MLHVDYMIIYSVIYLTLCSDVAEVFPMIVPILSNLSSQLENIESINKLNIGDGHLVR